MFSPGVGDLSIFADLQSETYGFGKFPKSYLFFVIKKTLA